MTFPRQNTDRKIPRVNTTLGNFRASKNRQEISERQTDTAGSNIGETLRGGGTPKVEEWCSIKEYRSISPWTKEVSERRIRQMIQTGVFPGEVRKVAHGRSGYAYQIRLTDEEEIKKLYRMRFTESTKDSYADTVAAGYSSARRSPDSSPPAYQLNFQVPAATMLDLAMQDKTIRRNYRNYLRACSRKASVPANGANATVPKKRYCVRCSEDMYATLQAHSSIHGLTIKESFVMMLMEYLNTTDGQVALCMSQAINNMHRTEREDKYNGSNVCRY